VENDAMFLPERYSKADVSAEPAPFGGGSGVVIWVKIKIADEPSLSLFLIQPITTYALV
jgi:hypothetical protein